MMADESEDICVVTNPHVSILHTSEKFRLTGCTDWSCGCHKFHCPLCPPSRLRPQSKAAILKHLGLHIKQCLPYKGLQLCMCKLHCIKDTDISHYHCPLCGKMCATGTTMKNHLDIVHEGKEGEIQLEEEMKIMGTPLDEETEPGQKKAESLKRAKRKTAPAVETDIASPSRKSKRTRGKSINYRALAHAGKKTSDPFYSDDEDGENKKTSELDTSDNQGTSDAKDDEKSSMQALSQVDSNSEVTLSIVNNKGSGNKDQPSNAENDKLVDSGGDQVSSVEVASDAAGGAGDASAALVNMSSGAVPKPETIIGEDDVHYMDLSRVSSLHVLPYPHPSIVKSIEELRLPKCTNPECNCGGGLHCPLCPSSHFKPVKYIYSLEKHLNWHMKFNIKFKGWMMCICKQDCNQYKTEAHFHCPLCGTCIVRRDNMESHFLTHDLKNMPEKRITERNEEYNDTREEAASAIQELLYTSPAPVRVTITDSSGKMGQVEVEGMEFIRKEMPITRLTLDNFPKSSAKQTMQLENLKIQHHTFLYTPWDILPQRYVKKSGKQSFYTCPLCPTADIPNAPAAHISNSLAEFLHHITEEHIKQGVVYNGLNICQCHQSCAHMEGAHYHCPDCGETCQDKTVYLQHLLTHPAGQQCLSSKLLQANKSQEASGDSDVENEDLKDDMVQEPGEDKTDEDNPIKLSEVEMYSSVTALLSKKLIEAIGRDSGEVMSEIASKTSVITAQMEDGQHVIQGSWKAMSKATKQLKMLAGMTEEAESDVEEKEGVQDDTSEKAERKPKTYICVVCMFAASNLHMMNAHMKKEHPEEFRCSYCGRIGISEADLRRHLLNIHEDHPDFDNKSDDSRKVPCTFPDCEYKAKDDTVLYYHKLLKHYIKGRNFKNEYQCKECNYTTHESAQLRAHLIRRHAKERYLCTICGKDFGMETDWKEHLKVVHERKTVCVCDLCGKEFTSKRYLSAHKQRHMGIKNHECDICGKRFREKIRMREHKETHLDPSVRVMKYQCPICEKRFANNFYMKDHMNTHTGQKPYECEVCGLKFALRLTMRNHLLKHSKDKPYKCEHCPKAFKTKVKLNYHMVTHTGVSKHNCDVCGKVFTQYATLKRHRCSGVPVTNKKMQVRQQKPVTEGDVATYAEETQQVILTMTESSADKQELYMCSLCNNIYVNWSDMEAHMSEHVDTGEEGSSMTHAVGDVAINTESLEMAIALAGLPDAV